MDAAAGMITYIVMPSNFIFIAFYLNLSKLYVNAYLATLNARENLRERTQQTTFESIPMSKIAVASVSNIMEGRRKDASRSADRKVHDSKDSLSISVEPIDSPDQMKSI